MNKPQLSAEIKTKVKKLIKENVKYLVSDPNDPRVGILSQDVMEGFIIHFMEKELVTALEEQKQLSYEIGKRDATKKWHENEQAWVELNKQSVIKHKQELATARAEGAAEERTMIIEEIKQVCKVHRYLDDKTRDKVIRFIENLGKPQPEMALTTKEHHAS